MSARADRRTACARFTARCRRRGGHGRPVIIGFMARARLSAPLVLVVAAVLVGGCGSGAHSGPAHSSTARSRAAARHHATPAAPANPANPAAPGRGRVRGSADARTVAVIQHWADALRRGDVRGAAHYFQIPSVFAPGPDQAVTLRSFAEAEAANRALPCGAKLISVMRLGGPLVQALFRLTGRPGPGGSSCNPGAGETARTNFVVTSGRIRVWLRAPDAPGDNQQPPSGGGAGGSGPTV